MHKLVILCLICLAFISELYAQTTDTILKTAQLIEQRNIYLNGGARASFGGKSRTYIKIDIPPHTVRWYYSFSTSSDESGTKSLKLLAQLSSFVADPMGIASSALSKVEVPTGSKSIDVFLCDRTNIDKFEAKSDNWLGEFTYMIEGSVQNTRQAVIEIDDVKQGTWYLGLKNPSSLDGVNITIEVTALVQDFIIVEKPKEQEKAELFGTLAKKQLENGDYKKCLYYCVKANEYFKLGWVNANMGLAQLMLQQESDAMQTYVDAILLIEKQSDPVNIFSEAINDLEKVIQNNPEISGATEIKDLLETEYDQFK